MKREDNIPAFWRDYSDRYRKDVGDKYTLDELCRAAIQSGEWEAGHEDDVTSAKRQAGPALRTAVDDNGVRLKLCVKNSQGEFWDDRKTATWLFRQGFLNEQSQRAVDIANKTNEMRDVLNAERKDGEAEFQVDFGWDGEAETA